MQWRSITGGKRKLGTGVLLVFHKIWMQSGHWTAPGQEAGQATHENPD